MILQDSLTSLNPAFNVGAQVSETMVLHQGAAEPRPMRETSARSDLDAERTLGDIRTS